MACHLIKANALLVEPIRCGTTWMAHALRAAGIETQQPETIGDCCLRHSFPHNYAGDFDHVIVPVRHPMTWLISYYDFFASRPAEVWQPGRCYAQKPFGSPMPCSFEAFVKIVVEDDLAGDYWRGFSDRADGQKTHFIRQEVLRDELASVLFDLGHTLGELERMDSVDPQNVTIPLSAWSEVDGDVTAAYEAQTDWIVDRFYRSPSDDTSSAESVVVVDAVESGDRGR